MLLNVATLAFIKKAVVIKRIHLIKTLMFLVWFYDTDIKQWYFDVKSSSKI